MGFFDSIARAIGSTFVSLGLESPTSRALAFGTVGFSFQYLARPSISYKKVGTKDGAKSIAKPFTLLATKDSPVETTYMPWYFWPLLFAIIGGLFL